jgi:hypothetical protein
MDCIHLVQEREKWWPLVNTVMNIWILKMVAKTIRGGLKINSVN